MLDYEQEDDDKYAARTVFVLDQDQWWTPYDYSQPQRLEELSPSHKTNLIKWLERNVHYLAESYINGLPYPDPNYMGEQAFIDVSIAVDQEIEKVLLNPVLWLRGKPLYRRLMQLIRDDEGDGIDFTDV